MAIHLVIVFFATIPMSCIQTLSLKDESFEMNNESTLFIETIYENDLQNDPYLLDPGQFSLRLCNLLRRSETKLSCAVNYDDLKKKSVIIQIRIRKIYNSLNISDDQLFRHIITLGFYSLANGNVRYEKAEISGEILYSNILKNYSKSIQFNFDLKNEYGFYDEDFKFIGNTDYNLIKNIGDRNPVYSFLFLPSFEKMMLQLIYEN